MITVFFSCLLLLRYQSIKLILTVFLLSNIYIQHISPPSYFSLIICYDTSEKTLFQDQAITNYHYQFVFSGFVVLFENRLAFDH